MRGRPLLLALTLGACSGEAGPSIFRTTPIALSFGTGNLVVTDLEGDALLELVSVASGGVAIRPWTDGRFGPATVRSLPDASSGMAVADLDGDGRQDLATALPLRSAIVWLDLAADATVREIGVDAAVHTLVAGDVDGDGFADLVVAASDELLLLRGGVGGPRLSQRLRLGEVDALVTVDLDGDGRTEVATSSLARGVVQLLSPTTDGGLVLGPVVWRTGSPVALAAADLDDDGALDLAAVDRLERRVWVGLGDGQGGWRRRSEWALEVEPAALLARRGPAGPELVVSGADGRSVVLVDPRTGASRARAAREVGRLTVADLDGDGVDELIHAAGFLRDAHGDSLRANGPSVGPATLGLVRVDLDGDGEEELVVEEADSAELVMYAIDGADLLELGRAPAPVDLGGLVPLARGDGGHDLAWWNYMGFGVLSGHDLELVSTTPQSGVMQLVPVKLDGAEEVAVVLSSFDGRLGMSPNLRGELLLTRRVEGSLVPFMTGFVGGPIGDVVRLPRSDATSDDLWLAHDSGVTLLRGSEGWAPTAASALAGLTGARAVDLDGDGVLDLVGCDVRRSRGVLAAHGLGDGALGPTERLSAATCTRVHVCEGDAGVGSLVLERGSVLGNYFKDSVLEILRRADAGWTSGGNLHPGLEAEQLAIRCSGDELTVWAGGGLGLRSLERAPGPALIEQSTSATAILSPPLLGDLDGDELDELVLDQEPYLMLARADGAGGLMPAVGHARPGDAGFARAVGLGEFDGQPGAELLVAGSDLDGRLTHAAWSFHDGRLVRTHGFAATTWEVLGDFDGDGLDELLTRDGGAPALVRPDAEPVALDPDLLAGLSFFHAADMDGDGRTDLLGSSDVGEVRLLRGEASGFARARVLPLLASLPGTGVGDLDRDGTLDLVFVSAGEGVTVCRRGRAGPADACTTQAWLEAPLVSERPVIADLDDDGHPDLALGWREFGGESSFQVLYGDSAGGLDPAPPQPLARGALRPARLGGDRPAWLMFGPGQVFRLIVGRSE